MQQFVFVPVSVYNNRCFNIQSVTKQELSKDDVEQNPTYQIHSLKKKFIEKLFAKAHLLVHELFLSTYQALKVEDFNIGGCRNWSLLVGFCLLTTSKKRKHARPILVYLTMLEYIQLWFWITMPKRKRGRIVSLSNPERRKLQRFHTQGAAAHVSLRNSAKASNLPVSKIRQFSHSKTSYTKIFLATRKFKTMKAGFRSEIWCLNLAVVDKLAKKDGVN